MGIDLFCQVTIARMRENGLRLISKGLEWILGKFSLWKGMSIVEWSSLDVLERCLNVVLGNMVYWWIMLGLCMFQVQY